MLQQRCPSCDSAYFCRCVGQRGRRLSHVACLGVLGELPCDISSIANVPAATPFLIIVTAVAPPGFLTCDSRSNTFMLNGASYQKRKVPAAEYRLRFAWSWLQCCRCRRSLDGRIWRLRASSFPLLAGSTETQTPGIDCCIYDSDDHQSSRRCSNQASCICTSKRPKYWRYRGTCRYAFACQSALAWLIAVGEALKYHWNIRSIACWRVNWNRYIPSLFPITPAFSAGFLN